MIPLELKDLPEALEALKHHRSTQFISIEDSLKSPIHILVYNEMMKYSKEELESVKNRHGHSNIIYDKAYSTGNPLILSALLSKKAFVDKLTQESQWLLNTINNYDTHQIIFSYEREKYENQPRDNQIYYIGSSLGKLETPEQKFLAQKIYEKYPDESIISWCFSNITSPLSDFWLEILKKDNIDINKFNLMNNYLPENKPKFDGSYSDFFISSLDFARMSGQLEKGFRFNEEVYQYNGDNLITALLKRKNYPNMIKLMLPYLSKIEPRQGTWEDQHQLVENLRGNKDYDEIKKVYYRLFLEIFEAKVPAKEHNIEKPKIKI